MPCEDRHGVPHVASPPHTPHPQIASLLFTCMRTVSIGAPVDSGCGEVHCQGQPHAAPARAAPSPSQTAPATTPSCCHQQDE